MNPLGGTNQQIKPKHGAIIGSSPKAPENGCLEDDPSFWGRLPARCELLVSGIVNMFFS